MTQVDFSDLDEWGACAFGACVATRWLPTAQAGWPGAAAAEHPLGIVWHWLEHGGVRPSLDRASLDGLIPVDGAGLLGDVPGAGATLSVVRPLIEVGALLKGLNTPADSAAGASIEGRSSADQLGWIEVPMGPEVNLETVRRHLDACSRAPCVLFEIRSQEADITLIRGRGYGPALARHLRATNARRGEEVRDRARSLGWI